MIYRIAIESELRVQLDAAFYRPTDLAEDGFVHCAFEASAIPVANDYYADVSGRLLLLEIDPERLSSETRREPAAPIAGGGAAHLAGAPEFPHVYGPIDREAVTRVGVLEKGENGYAWPRALRSLDAFLADAA